MIILVFLIPAGVNGQGCIPSSECAVKGAAASPTITCPDIKSCGNLACVNTYTPCHAGSIGTCKGTTAKTASTCAGCEEVCEAAAEMGCEPAEKCYAPKEAGDSAAIGLLGEELIDCAVAADTAQKGILSGGNFITSITPCPEMNNCYLSSAAGVGTTAEGFKSGCLSKEAIKEFINKNPQLKNSINQYGAENIKDSAVRDGILESGFDEADPKLAEAMANYCKGVCDQAELNQWFTNQPRETLADIGVRKAMAAANIQIPWWKQLVVLEEIISSNPYVKAAKYLYAAGSTVFGLLKPDPEPVQKQYYQQNYIVAQNDINDKTASDSTGLGTSTWVVCQNHRDIKCARGADCFKDIKQGAVQCAAALPNSEQVKVTFSSINVIDKEEINMYTLTGEENTGVVYEENGFVNIDKGGTTKVQVAGDGAYVSDVNNNLLVLDKGTTTYYGTGNEFEDVYVTNTYVLDLDTMISFNSLNPQEQSKYREKNSKYKDINELAVTFGKGKLANFKNAIDEKKNGFSSEIQTRGFSNAAILEKRKYFPFVTRIFAKGDSTIIRNQNVMVESQHKVNDEKYTYIIKSNGRSTQVYNANGFILEDSGQLMRELSRRQLFMLYNRTN